MPNRLTSNTPNGAGHSAGPYVVAILAKWLNLAKWAKADAAQG
jgi:hypothetical protein